jgi:hypothetical protein
MDGIDHGISLYGDHRPRLKANITSDVPKMSRSERIAVGVVAAVTWTGLIIQASVSFPGMLAKGLTLSDAFIRFFSFFTVLTNTFIAADSVILFVKGESRWSNSQLHSSLETCLAVSILFVMAGFTILLRSLVHFTGTELLADNFLHYAAPMAFLFYWCLFTSRYQLPWSHAAWWVLYPFLYFLYALIQGWRTGLYPYPFIDAGRIGYTHTLINGGVLLLLFWLCSMLFIGLGRTLHRRRTASR